eukprot:403339352
MFIYRLNQFTFGKNIGEYSEQNFNQYKKHSSSRIKRKQNGKISLDAKFKKRSGVTYDYKPIQQQQQKESSNSNLYSSNNLKGNCQLTSKSRLIGNNDESVKNQSVKHKYQYASETRKSSNNTLAVMSKLNQIQRTPQQQKAQINLKEKSKNSSFYEANSQDQSTNNAQKSQFHFKKLKSTLNNQFNDQGSFSRELQNSQKRKQSMINKKIRRVTIVDNLENIETPSVISQVLNSPQQIEVTDGLQRKQLQQSPQRISKTKKLSSHYRAQSLDDNLANIASFNKNARLSLNLKTKILNQSLNSSYLSHLKEDTPPKLIQKMPRQQLDKIMSMKANHSLLLDVRLKKQSQYFDQLRRRSVGDAKISDWNRYSHLSSSYHLNSQNRSHAITVNIPTPNHQSFQHQNLSQILPLQTNQNQDNLCYFNDLTPNQLEQKLIVDPNSDDDLIELGELDNHNLFVKILSNQIVYQQRQDALEKLDFSIDKLKQTYQKIQTPHPVLNRHRKIL